MKILISKNIPEQAVTALREAGFELLLTEKGQQRTKAEFIAACQSVDLLLFVGGGSLDADFFKQCSHLKGVSLTSVGYNNVDMEAATQAGIPVSNTPDVLSDATADTALLLMLGVSRKAFYRGQQIVRGEWKNFEFTDDLGISLYGKTLGIYGLGRIGLVLARKAKLAFGMDIIYHNRSRNLEAEEELGARYVTFDELLAQSDVLSVHTNLSPETAGRFDASAFKKMKSSAIFVNTARGGIHHEADLTEALLQGEIWGAGLDVTSPEPMLPDNALLQMPNVMVLPHIGSATIETRTDMAMLAVANLKAVSEGREMPQVVNVAVYNR